MKVFDECWRLGQPDIDRTIDLHDLHHTSKKSISFHITEQTVLSIIYFHAIRSFFSTFSIPGKLSLLVIISGEGSWTPKKLLSLIIATLL